MASVYMFRLSESRSSSSSGWRLAWFPIDWEPFTVGVLGGVLVGHGCGLPRADSVAKLHNVYVNETTDNVRFT